MAQFFFTKTTFNAKTNNERYFNKDKLSIYDALVQKYTKNKRQKAKTVNT